MRNTSATDPHWPRLHREHRAILVVDVVESVRLMQQHEDAFIERWRRFVLEVESLVLPLHQGRLVKSLGDGMLLEFENPRNAVRAALDLQQRAEAHNGAFPEDQSIHLRMAGHVADVVIEKSDIYGRGVNLAARLATLAEPGGIVMSVDLCDVVIPELDCEIADLGECDLKGVSEPVRAYKIAAAPLQNGRQVLWDDSQRTTPLFLVMPFDAVVGDEDSQAIAQVMSDDLIVGLSASPHWRVVSRLSALRLSDRSVSIESLKGSMQANFVLSGRCASAGDSLRVTAELADTSNGSVIWAGTVVGKRGDLFMPQNPLAEEIIGEVSGAVFAHEIKRSRSQPLPSLRSFTLLFGAITLMHRLSRVDFEKAWALLEHLAERHPRAPEPRVWAAKWHALKVTQGWSADPAQQVLRAHASVQRALEQQGDNSLGLAIDGLITGFLQGDLRTAEQRYMEAIAVNPSESMAWLFLSALMAYTDRGEEAVKCASSAIRLSPLDPMRYFYDSFAANALLAAGRHEESIVVGERSVRANATHMPTYRSLAIAQVLAGQVTSARDTMARLLKLRPDYSLQQFRERYAGRDGKHAPAYFEALRTAGLPETS